MKVICKNCSRMVDENDAIKMNMVEFKSWQMAKYDIPFFTSYELEYNIYTQICQECYGRDL